MLAKERIVSILVVKAPVTITLNIRNNLVAVVVAIIIVTGPAGEVVAILFRAVRFYVVRAVIVSVDIGWQRRGENGSVDKCET